MASPPRLLLQLRNANTVIQDAGWKRKCEDCGAEHFPRVDPVAIMLAVHGDKCLMGRQKAWRPGFWSCLAGFVEPGETFEQAAAREVLEEAGVRCTGRAEYLFCQPWPFPSSLMIGLILEADGEELKIDTGELETARWFTRDEAKAMMAGSHPDAYPPHALRHRPPRPQGVAGSRSVSGTSGGKPSSICAILGSSAACPYTPA